MKLKLSLYLFFCLLILVSTLDKNCPTKCNRGQFIYNNSCFSFCPSGTYADNYSQICKHPEENPISIKAYSFSKCLDSCGKDFKDCSCSANCKQKGDCCSDYMDYCDGELKFGDCNESSTDINCEICETTGSAGFLFQNLQKCVKCKQGFVLYKNSCIKKQSCGIDHCLICEKKSKECKKCENGMFLLNNSKCVKTCPIGFVADKESESCLAIGKIENAYYWTYPSKESCNNKCGLKLTESDCSCSSKCMREGNCCDDFDKECEKLKDSYKIVEAEFTPPKQDYIEISGSNALQSGNNLNMKKIQEMIASLFDVQIKLPIENSQNRTEHYNTKTKDPVIPSFPNFDSFFNSSNQNKSHLLINGNVTMNVYSNNENPIIRNEHIINNNSYNKKVLNEINKNAQNVLVGDSSNKNTNTSSYNTGNSDSNNPGFQKYNNNNDLKLNSSNSNSNTTEDKKWVMGDIENSNYDYRKSQKIIARNRNKK